jgi:tetratricopeptide (TPR) repeat protein
MMLRRKSCLVGLLLVAVTMAAYWPVLDNDFISLDDHEYVTENPHVISGLSWSNADWAFRSGYASNWHPLTWLSHQLDVQLFGLKPRWHHFTSLLLHLANSLLLFSLLRRMTGAPWRSAFVAALFALHPLHVESVAWVAERKDVLSTFFFMLTLIAYAKYTEVQSSKFKVQSQKAQLGTPESLQPSITNHPTSSVQHPTSSIRYPASVFYLLALLLFALGLMSKPMLVTLPFVLLLLDYWPLQRFGSSTINHQLSTIRRLLLEKLPFFTLSAGSSVITFLAQSRSHAVSVTMPFEARLANSITSYLRYLQKALWPANLSLHYPHPTVLSPEMDPWGWQTLIAALVVLVLSGWAVWRLKREPWFAVGWFWYLGTLVPVIGVVQVGGQAMADRYTYIPLIGIFIVVAWSLEEFVSHARLARSKRDTATAAHLAGGARPSSSAATPDMLSAQNSSGPCLPGRIAAPDDGRTPGLVSRSASFALLLSGAGGLAVLAACAVVTRNQVGFWHSTFSLFEHALAATGQNPMAHYCLGQVYAQQGRHELAENHYRIAAHEAPTALEPHVGLGTLFYQQGKLEDALEQFQAALRLGSFNGLTHNYLGLTYQRLGRKNEALEEFAKAVTLAPEFSAGHSNLGATLAGEGRFEEAAAQYHVALACDPGSASAHFGLGSVLTSQGKRDEAVPEYKAALRFNPTNAAALNDLAWIRASAPDAGLRNGAEAVRLAELACKLTEFREPQRIGTLAAAYAEAGRFEDAVKTGEKAKALALASGQSALAARNEDLLTLYRAGKPYHEAK